MKSNENVKILGSGDCSGGEYNEVKIYGSGDINGDLKCNELKIVGSGDVNGNIDVKEMKISGAADIHGNVQGGNIDVAGAADISGNVTCTNLKVSGCVDIDGSTKTEKIEIKGGAEISENCDSEIFYSSGAFEIGGMLNAEEITIKLKGKNSIKEIGGENIKIIKNSDTTLGKILSIPITFGNSLCKLECETIEGDEIYLEYTYAKTVRGKNIKLGPTCHIENVEYSESFNMSKDSKVEFVKQI